MSAQGHPCLLLFPSGHSDILTWGGFKVLALSSTGCSKVKRTRRVVTYGNVFTRKPFQKPMGMCLQGGPSRKAPARLQAAGAPHHQEEPRALRIKTSVLRVFSRLSSHPTNVWPLTFHLVPGTLWHWGTVLSQNGWSTSKETGFHQADTDLPSEPTLRDLHV